MSLYTETEGVVDCNWGARGFCARAGMKVIIAAHIVVRVDFGFVRSLLVVAWTGRPDGFRSPLSPPKKRTKSCYALFPSGPSSSRVATRYVN
jgi:hypothetical protein